MSVMITKKEIIDAQNLWSEAVINIGALKDNIKECKIAGKALIQKLYAFDIGTVLFKPTLAAKHPFRLTEESALSYFIGSNSSFSEDVGFALTPWKAIRFDNKDLIINGGQAITMGHYFFTNFNDQEIKVEVTFGYIKDKNDQLKINLHHSSMPYSNQIN